MTFGETVWAVIIGIQASGFINVILNRIFSTKTNDDV